MTPEISIFATDYASTSSVQQHELGQRAHDKDGNEYVYVKGVGSAVVGDAAVFDEDYQIALALSSTPGPVCVLGAALTANLYGWGQICGEAQIRTAGDVADNALVQVTSTPGAVDDASTTRVNNAIFRAARTGAGLVKAQLYYPVIAM